MSQTVNFNELYGAFCPILFFGGGIISNNNNKKNDSFVNEDIKVKEMLVITDKGENLGVLSKAKALDEAYNRDLDLVLVSPEANPPVAKMMDYSRFRFEQQKRAKDAKKKQKVVVVQEIQISPTIDKHDFDTKVKKAKTIMVEKGNKVKVSCRLYSRFLAKKEIGFENVQKFIEALSDVATVESDVKMDGKIVFAVVAPKKDIKKGE